MTQLIRELAHYEREPNAAIATEQDLLRDGFDTSTPLFQCLIAEWEGEPAGFAFFFTTYSTFLGRPGLYLEDLFVVPAARGKGAGRALLARLAAITVERNYGRLEWAVLDWNEPAIGFYKKLGATPMDSWTIFRVTGDALQKLAAS